MEQQAANGARSDFSHRVVGVLGAMQIVLGSLCVLFGIIILLLNGAISFIAAPLWCGAIFIVTGLLGVLAANWKTSGVIISSMVMCILTATLFYPTLFGIMVATMVIEAIDSCYYDYSRHGSWGDYICDDRDTKLAIEGVILFLGFIDFVVAIVNSAFCCGALCCKPRNVSPVVYYTVQPGGVPQQVPMATTQYGQQVILVPPSGPSAPPPYGPYNTQPMFVQPGAVPMAGTSAPYGQGEPGAGYGYGQPQAKGEPSNDTLPPAYA
ncbi:membrane-spanning 4-domains subfamily A member 4A-like isoform X2 [Ptychodera flava]|uniref:membrane-spanning 4-domains subfamily A member 4A-like isoform X2 n=1 Tax=Ptychodera flava TaxID=63121 RepID=UPI003969E843